MARRRLPPIHGTIGSLGWACSDSLRVRWSAGMLTHPAGHCFMCVSESIRHMPSGYSGSVISFRQLPCSSISPCEQVGVHLPSPFAALPDGVVLPLELQSGLSPRHCYRRHRAQPIVFDSRHSMPRPCRRYPSTSTRSAAGLLRRGHAPGDQAVVRKSSRSAARRRARLGSSLPPTRLQFGNCCAAPA